MHERTHKIKFTTSPPATPSMKAGAHPSPLPSPTLTLKVAARIVGSSNRERAMIFILGVSKSSRAVGKSKEREEEVPQRVFNSSGQPFARMLSSCRTVEVLWSTSSIIEGLQRDVRHGLTSTVQFPLANQSLILPPRSGTERED